MLDYFSRCFAEDDFCRLDEIERVIEASGYHKKTREAMMELSNRLCRGKIMDKVFERMESDGWEFDRKDILDRRLKDLQRQLTAAGSDMERMKQLFEEYKHTQELRNMLARQVGSDVVV